MENNEKKTAQLIIESLKLKDKELSRNGYDLQSPFRQGFMLAETIVKKTVNKNKADEDLSDNEKKLFSLLGLNEPSPDKGETATGEGELEKWLPVWDVASECATLGQFADRMKKFSLYDESIQTVASDSTTPPKGIEAGKSLEDVNREAELRYPVLTHSNPNDSPYKDSNKAFVNGALYASQQQEDWNTIEDFQPDSARDVMVSDIESGIVDVGMYIDKEKTWYTDKAMTVTHWKELPKPPKQ